MRNYLTIAILAMGISLGACQSETKKVAKAEESACKTECSQCSSKSCGTTVTANATVGIYYFHGDRKCKTCKVVGKTAKEVVTKMSADKLSVEFFDVNLDEAGNENLAKEFEASGSSLYIKNHKSGKIEDLTSFAFRNAINDAPAYIEKLNTVVKAELK